jgi:hypothetical protein
MMPASMASDLQLDKGMFPNALRNIIVADAEQS